MRIAICPGSFDPITIGHVNIIERSLELFDEIIVLLLHTRERQYYFTPKERIDMLRDVTAKYPNVKVDHYDGLVAEYAKKHEIPTLIKGLRAVSDFENEFQMALMNKEMYPDLETVFINTDAEYMYLSASAVREMAEYGADISRFVPEEAKQAVYDKLVRPNSSK